MSNQSFSSDFGTTGIIDIPNSRMLNDGILNLTYSSQKQQTLQTSHIKQHPGSKLHLDTLYLIPTIQLETLLSLMA